MEYYFTCVWAALSHLTARLSARRALMWAARAMHAATNVRGRNSRPVMSISGLRVGKAGRPNIRPHHGLLGCQASTPGNPIVPGPEPGQTHVTQLNVVPPGRCMFRRRAKFCCFIHCGFLALFLTSRHSVTRWVVGLNVIRHLFLLVLLWLSVQGDLPSEAKDTAGQPVPRKWEPEGS